MFTYPPSPPPLPFQESFAVRSHSVYGMTRAKSDDPHRSGYHFYVSTNANVR